MRKRTIKSQSDFEKVVKSFFRKYKGVYFTKRDLIPSLREICYPRMKDQEVWSRLIVMYHDNLIDRRLKASTQYWGAIKNE